MKAPMKMSKNTMTQKIIALAMSLVMAVTLLPVTAFAAPVETEETTSDSPDLEDVPSLEETISLEADVSEENAVMVESTENATVFDLGDGKKKIVYHSQDVRFEENGELVDYDPTLVAVEEEESENGESLADYKYENQTGDSTHYLPEELSEDSQILMEKDGYSIKMLPLDEYVQNKEVVLEKEETLTPYEEVKEKQTIAVYEAKDESLSYEYTSLNQGLKESIVLNERPETNVFRFRLELTGMYAELNEEENTILLKEKKQNGTGEEVLAFIDRPFMNDATGEAYSEELVYSLEKVETDSYIVTLTVSQKYLNAEDRVYPITIDPTATWKGSEKFLDVYVLNGDHANINFYADGTTVMPVGVGTKGTYRTYIKLPELKNTVSGKYVDSAELTMYETGSSDSGQTVRLNRVTENWQPGTITWNNKPAYNTAAYANQFVTKGNTYQEHKVAVTATVRNFVNSNNYANYGLVMRNVTEDPGYAVFFGSRYAVAQYRPKLVVTYYDKPTVAEGIYTTRKNGDDYVKTSYFPKGYRIFANWKGIKSHNLSAVQYKFIGLNGTADPDSVHADEVNLTSYRTTGQATENGTNVGLDYTPSLPAGVYRLYIRGKDAGGMYGTARYKTIYVDGDAPSLTNVSVTPATTESSVTSNCTPKVSWKASDTYFSKVTVTAGNSIRTASTTAGNGTYTIPSGAINKSGKHTITVKVYDKSGKSTSKTVNYYVDVDKPVIQSVTVTPGTTSSAASSEKRPTVNWSIQEDHLAKVEVWLNGTKKYTTTNDSITSYRFASGALTTTGKYTIDIKATDASGNTATKTVSYYLDIDKPVFQEVSITPQTTALTPAANKSPKINWKVEEAALDAVYYSLDQSNWRKLGVKKENSISIISSIWGADSGTFIVYVKAVDKAGNVSNIQELTYHLNMTGSYVPEDLQMEEYYGKRYLTWELDAYDSEVAAYDLHRSVNASFTPGNNTLVEADIDASRKLYIDKEILENDTYYYKIVVRDLTGNNTSANSVSEEVAFDNTLTTEQFGNTFGQKSYLSYLDLGLPMGNLSVEESSGNVLYSQSEFVVSNDQMSYGLDRTYNSQNTGTSMLGTGWTDSWHKEIYTDGTDIYYVDSDGSSYLFQQAQDGYICEETKEYELFVTEDGYEITDKEDQVFKFDKDGHLIEISEPNGATVSYTYDELGRLAVVSSKEGTLAAKELSLTYEGNSRLLKSVEDFAGTIYQYEYTGNKLTKVTISSKEDASSSVSYEYSYGEEGLLSGIKDGMGNLYPVTYNSGKKAASIAYPDGEKFTFTYSEGSTKVEKYTPDQTKIHEEFITFDTATGKLLSYTDAKGNVTSYEYVEGRPYLVAKIKNTKAYQSINDDNKVVFHEEENVVETEYAYDENENVVIEQSADERTSVFAYDANDNLTAEIELINADELLSDIHDNVCDNLQIEQDAEDSVTVKVNGTAYDYEQDDITNNQKNIYDTRGNLIVTEDLISDIMEENEYENEEQNEEENEIRNLTATIVIDKKVLELQSAEEKTAELSEETMASEKRNAIDRAADPEVINVVTYKYDSQGNVELEQTASREVYIQSEITSDVMGRGCKSTENGITTETIYDFLGRDIKTTTKEEGKEDIVVIKEYNANGTLISESSSLGITKTYTYDSRNRLLKTTTTGSDIATTVSENSYGYETNLSVHSGTGTSTEAVVYTEAVKDSSGTVISINYTDSLGRTVKEISGTTYTDYTYDVSGNSVISYEGNTVNEEALISMTLYDSEGRSFAELTAPQISDSDYIIGDETVITYTEYDTKGNTSKETDALGTAVHYTYDEEGKLASTDITGDGEDIAVTYSVQEDGGELIRVTDANDNVKEEYLNAAGLTVQTADLDGNSEENTGIVTSYEYDTLGRKTAEKYSDGTFVSYSYDGDSDRVLEKTEYLDEETVESTSTYTYDSKNQVTGIQHKEGTETVAAYAYTYDVSGRVLTESVSYDSETEKVTAYEYDAEGRLVKVIYPESSGIGTITYTYDSFGNVLEIKKDNVLVRDYTYDAFYRVISIKDYDTPGSGSYTLKTYTYDNFGRTVSAVYTEDGDSTKVLESFAYSYDKNDNILSETRISNLPAEDKVINETRDYIYDAYGRLTQSTITDHTAEDAETVTTYEYDAVGNRTKQTRAGVETTYEYNGLNQLTHMETPTEEVEYNYDSRGNQIEEKNTTTGEITETTYNVAGEMIQLVKKNGETTVFTQTNVYNQDGSRISRTQGEIEKEYYYHNGVVAFTEDNNVLSASNLQDETGSVFGTYRGEDYYNYLKNLQGSTMSITGENGQAAAVYTYSDFGETEEVVADSIGNEICYTGAVCDKDTGLYYMNARYYDAVTGRFISQDSYRGEVEDAGTWHLYAYCANDPINHVDPSGHSALSIATKGITMIFGSVTVGTTASIAAVCVGAFLAIKGYQKWGATTKKKVDKAIFDTALRTVVVTTSSAEFIKGISISVARAKVAIKKGKDEKHHIVPQTAKSTKKAKATLIAVKIPMNSSKNTVMLDYRLHRRLHRKTYYTYINKYIPSHPCNTSSVTNRLNKIKIILNTANNAVKSV